MANHNNPLVGTPLTSKGFMHDLILWECNPSYCRGAITVGAGTYKVGQVIANATQAPSAVGYEPTQSDVLCLKNITVPSGQSRDIPAFVRGPALINFDAVVRASADETDSELATRLADLLSQGVRFVRQPVHHTNPDITTLEPDA